MAKAQFKSNPKLAQIFEDLDAYREFCVEYGYKFNEADLYNMRTYSYQQFSKKLAGKNFKDQWADDERRMVR